MKSYIQKINPELQTAEALAELVEYVKTNPQEANLLAGNPTYQEDLGWALMTRLFSDNHKAQLRKDYDEAVRQVDDGTAFREWFGMVFIMEMEEA